MQRPQPDEARFQPDAGGFCVIGVKTLVVGLLAAFFVTYAGAVSAKTGTPVADEPTAGQTIATTAAPAVSTARPTVTASFDRDSVQIGDQFNLVVRVEKDLMQLVDFPQFATFGDGNVELVGAEDASADKGDGDVEMLKEFPADTVSQDGRRQTIEKKYLITIWEAGGYDLGTVPVLSVGVNAVDTLYSAGQLRIIVSGFEIDPEKDQPFDIRPPVKISLKFSEIAGWIALALGIAAVLGIAIWLLIKYRHKIPILGGEKPRVPPHVEAIRKLEALRNQKLPQNGRQKQYWSGLSDILRGYLDGRFGIGAMEMTTDEILAAVAEPRKEGLIDEKRYENLAGLLRTADLVKFAKLLPEDDQTDAAWFDAYYFVEETKLAEENTEPDKEL